MNNQLILKVGNFMVGPKQKLSKSRTRSRRSANRVSEMPTFEQCPQCKTDKRPHFACEKCGFYKKTKNGSVVSITIKQKKEKKAQ
jgi:large subunit ribosomal protein L32